jgi:large subunit ribosomal protein L31
MVLVVMRSNLHPVFYADALVTCACGNSFITGSTSPRLQVETCSACHPFFSPSATQRPASSRIDRFNARLARL